MGGLLRGKYLDREQEKKKMGRAFRVSELSNLQKSLQIVAAFLEAVCLPWLPAVWQQFSCKEQLWFHTLFPPDQRLSVPYFQPRGIPD